MRKTLSFAIAVVLMPLVVFAFMKNDSGEKKWEVEGVLSDACQCQLFCPCEFMSKPTVGHCDDAAILHINKGHYGGVKLDNLRVAVVSQSPDGERLVDTVGHLKFARIYIPMQVTDEQAEALAQVARRTFGAFVTDAARLSENEKVERVDMEVVVKPHHHKVHIPGILDLELVTVTGGDGETPMVFKNGPFEEAGFGEVLIAQSKVYKYKNSDVDVDWDYGGRSASIRTFKLGGDIE